MSQVALRDVVADAVYIELRLRGSEDDLQRALDTSLELAPDPGGAPQPRRVVQPDGTLQLQTAPQADFYYRVRN